MGVESDHYDWRAANFATVVLVYVRALSDPALAWDVSMEGVAAATLAWETFPGGSRKAWVLEHGHRVLRDAAESGRVSSHERRRKQVTATTSLSAEQQRSLLERAGEPLHLDPDAAAVADRVAREAPPPRVLRGIALSPLTERAGMAPEREHG